MFWMYPEQKYNQTAFACYDSSNSSHFCQKGENWGAFRSDECEWIISLSKNLVKRQGYKVQSLEPRYRQVTAWGIDQTKETNWIWQRLINNVITANNRWWNYDIVGILETLELHYYDSTNNSSTRKDYYDLHTDNEYPFSCRKISFSVELSDPNTYQGAQLNLYVKETPSILPKTRGTMIMFPSFILHEVTPISEGKRWSLVGWVSGHQLR